MSATNFWVGPKLHPFLLSILPTSYLMCSLSTFNKVKQIRDDLDLQTSVSLIHDDAYTDAVFDAFQLVSEEHVRKVILKSAPKNLFTWSYANASVRWMFRWTPPRCQTQNQLISCLWRCSTEFKTAIVKPLLKKPSLDHNNLKNYRPVSNLSFLSKLWEKKSLCLNSLPTTCSAPPSQPTVQRTALRRHYWK